MYQRYDVEVQSVASSAGVAPSRRDLPIEEQTDAELLKNLVRQSFKSKSARSMALAALMILTLIIVRWRVEDDSSAADVTVQGRGTNLHSWGGAWKQHCTDCTFTPGRPSHMDPDSHKRNNPFAPPGTTTVMEGKLEIKRIGGGPQEQQQPKDTKKGTKRVRGRWNPCQHPGRYEWERHSHEPRHGDLCRARGGLTGVFECPDGCHETAGSAPFCANDLPQKRSTKTFGARNRPCRVRNPDAPPEYRCDGDEHNGVCIMAVGSPKEQFKGEGVFHDATCDNKCANRQAPSNKCLTDLDCSLAGVCLDGKCHCDPWADGPDCSYLKFTTVSKSQLGYLNEYHSSWGGSIVQGSDGLYHMFTSEIVCPEQKNRLPFSHVYERETNRIRKRCGLSNWETHSQISRATSWDIEGPYRRIDVVLDSEHHNPSVHVSPKTGDWHLFSISGSTGPIVRMSSADEGKTWTVPMVVSPRQNPGPVLKEDGSTLLFYRADGMDLPSPTCSNEGIAMQFCPSDTEPCQPPNDVPIFAHTGEDPSVFRDHRGNYHMLFNALPYKCVPKLQQGGHAWSSDGINWSAPRIGAFDTTIRFTDGSSMTCERRERPQMVTGKDGRPVALVSGVTGCPKALGGAISKRNEQFYRGGDDSFTLVQRMAPLVLDDIDDRLMGGN
ncbi:hypothetical protein ACHAXT_008828 [Thalassiosira profunda]